MYNFNTSQNDARVNYYSVTGVPDAFLMGTDENSPASFTQADVDNIVSQTSPLKIRVTDVDNGTDHTVTVAVESWGVPPAGSNWKLRTVIIERNVTYATPPGTNGETYFPNVMRKMLPGTSGDPVTFAAEGGSVSFSYSYTEDALWNMDEIGVVAFVQDDDTKAIENCGASFDADAALAAPAVLTHAGNIGTSSSFDITASNYGSGIENFSFNLTNDAPGDWTSNFVVNAITYTSSATVTLDANASITATINVTPGSTPAIGAYTLTITSLDNLAQDPVTQTVYVFRGITDLVVNAPGTQGDGTGVKTEDWDANYVNGLVNAGSTTSSVIDGSIAERASVENSLTDVQHIYYNVGWSFPAFTDSWITQLESLMNSGVNLFIAGQDIGWDVWTDAAAGGHATIMQQDFYTNYLFSEWIADGGSTNSTLTAVVADPIFGSLGTLPIIHYYGGTYFYPDEIAPLGIGTAIFNYASTTRVGGVRADNGTFKVVYVAPGLEMLSAANSDKVMKATYDWFHGITGVQEINNDMYSVGNNYPNPSDEVTYIPVDGLKGFNTLTITNTIGQVIKTVNVDATTSLISVNTSGFVDGIYHYYLSGNEKTTSHTFQVIH